MSGGNHFIIPDRLIEAKSHHYTACGLDDVYLLNGFEVVETDYGRGVAVERVDELHRAIAMHLIAHKKQLSPAEFRFLRKQMDLTQNDLAKRFGVDSQTVARYEKGTSEIPGPADKWVRTLYVFSRLPADLQEKLMRDVMALIEVDDPPVPHHAVFESVGSKWLEAAA